MNKKFMMALCLTFIAMGSYGQEQKSATSSTETSHYYLQIEDVASSLSLLPAPPQPGSAQFLYDQYQYLWGKAQRDTPRGDVAVTDARVTGDGVPYAFSEAFGITISKETTPEIYTLITHMREDAGDLATREAKEHYMRHVHSSITTSRPAIRSNSKNYPPTVPTLPGTHLSDGQQR